MKKTLICFVFFLFLGIKSVFGTVLDIATIILEDAFFDFPPNGVALLNIENITKKCAEDEICKLNYLDKDKKPFEFYFSYLNEATLQKNTDTSGVLKIDDPKTIKNIYISTSSVSKNTFYISVKKEKK